MPTHDPLLQGLNASFKVTESLGAEGQVMSYDELPLTAQKFIKKAQLAKICTVVMFSLGKGGTPSTSMNPCSMAEFLNPIKLK